MVERRFARASLSIWGQRMASLRLSQLIRDSPCRAAKCSDFPSPSWSINSACRRRRDNDVSNRGPMAPIILFRSVKGEPIY